MILEDRRLDKDRLIAEKVLTVVYSKLCDACKKKFKQILIELELTNAEEIVAELGISL